MNIKMSLIEGLLKVIGRAHPALAPLLDMVIKYEPEIENLAPVIHAAVKEGPGAIAAAEQHAPELAAAIREYVRTLPAVAATKEEGDHAVSVASENVARELVGLDHMTAEEERERKWMDSTPPQTDVRMGG